MLRFAEPLLDLLRLPRVYGFSQAIQSGTILYISPDVPRHGGSIRRRGRFRPEGRDGGVYSNLPIERLSSVTRAILEGRE